MVRILHTADLQLGMTFPGAGTAATRLHEARYDVVDRIVDLATERDADLLVAAGDVFDRPEISSARLMQLIATLGRTGIPVLLLPGNHDPDRPGGIWERREWDRAGDHIHVLRSSDPVRFDELGTVIHPCPLHEAHDTVDPTAQLLDADPQCIAVGVAHGSLPVGGQPGNHPIDLARAAAAGLDYLALGDWHSLRVEQVGDMTAAYPGTPEPTRFGERDSGSVLLVEIDGPRATPRYESIPVGRFRWEQWECRIEAVADAAALTRRLAAIPEPDRAVLELRLVGAPTLDALVGLDAVEVTGRKLACFRMTRDGLRLRADPDEIARLAPPGPLGRAVTRVAEHLGSDDEQRRVAEEALALFHELVQTQ